MYRGPRWLHSLKNAGSAPKRAGRWNFWPAAPMAPMGRCSPHGFSRRLLASLVRIKLAGWHHKIARAGGRTIDVGYMMITTAGRKAIEE
jgi:hypothetical protein